MTHKAETNRRLQIIKTDVSSTDVLLNQTTGNNEVVLVVLPNNLKVNPLTNVYEAMAKVGLVLGRGATLITLGNPVDLVRVAEALEGSATGQLWISIKASNPENFNNGSLKTNHFGALVHTKYQGSLKHNLTRIAYTYCPACQKTTKDYGGKKHTYHEYGTLISDVWRDINSSLNSDLEPVIDRFADLFAISSYEAIHVLDCRSLFPSVKRSRHLSHGGEREFPLYIKNRILQGDAIRHLEELPENSVDFIFADPPYNLEKGYQSYKDNLESSEYFEWCNKWLFQLSRIVKPGRTVAVLNIPFWVVKHFSFLTQHLQFQNWIAWDALSYPVRQIMPAHYPIICFSKGTPRLLPGLQDKVLESILVPQSEFYCLRKNCLTFRSKSEINDRSELTDLWWDIHRLKHNSRRVNHPTQLPPQLMERLISLFTYEEEIVLDPFNGSGTTTLVAEQLHRTYVGIELSEDYASIAKDRHKEIESGVDPFRKADRELTAKNSPVPRVKKTSYVVPKKTLQLEVRRVAAILGRIPNREELASHSIYPMQYYDDYFVNWREVTAAARTNGMTENKK